LGKIKLKSKDARRLQLYFRAAFSSEEMDPAVRERLQRMRLIFTVTNGRSGTGLLAQLFSCLDGVRAEHEAKPGFEYLMRDTHRSPSVCRRYLSSIHLPEIARSAEDTYVDTSHLFSKGWIEHALSLGLTFDAVVLTRDARKTACSMYRLNTIPRRTRIGRWFYMSPNVGTITRLEDPAKMTDYQLCYWHALETEARQEHYARVLPEKGVGLAQADCDVLTKGGFERLADALGIEIGAEAAERLRAVSSQVVNPKRKKAKRTRVVPSVDQLDEEERQVRALLRVS